jgi:hypothetical protein
MTDLAVVVQVARLPFLAGDGGASPTPRLHLTTATVQEVNPLLAASHYLGPIDGADLCFAGWVDDVLVACQAWRAPTARLLGQPSALELSRWCLTADAGRNAGSRMMGWAARELRRLRAAIDLGVSYSDPSCGHTGALYRASGWVYAPTHHSLRFDANGKGYPSGHGSWDGVTVQAPKHRWFYYLRRH